MAGENKRFKIIYYDKDGPTLDNNFKTDIVVQEESGGDKFCVGLNFRGSIKHSSLDAEGYHFSEANRHRGDRTWPMSEKRLGKLFEGSNMSLEKLKDEYAKLIRKH